MSTVTAETYTYLYPTGYPETADALRTTFINTFLGSSVNGKFIPQPLNAIRKLYKQLYRAFGDFSNGKFAEDFKVTWDHSTGTNDLKGNDIVNMYNLYVSTLQTKMSLLFLVADEAYDNFVRYIRIKDHNPSASISYVKSNQYLIDQIPAF